LTAGLKKVFNKKIRIPRKRASKIDFTKNGLGELQDSRSLKPIKYPVLGILKTKLHLA
jgi:hypothetical protein